MKDALSIIGIVAFIYSVFMMLPISNFLYRLIPLFQRIEFPWRYMSLNLFSLSLIVSVIINKLEIKYQNIGFIIIFASGLFLYLPFAKGHDYKIISDDYYLYQIRENTDAYATLPRWAAAPDLYPRITEIYKLISGQIELTLISRTSTRHVYLINALKDSNFADTTFYFPGWTVFIDNKPVNIEFQNPDYRGIITFNIPKGNHLVEVLFLPTKVRRLADIISLISIIILLFILYYDSQKKKFGLFKL